MSIESTLFTVLMAQEQGFEPWHRVTDLQAFQACPFNHLGIPAWFTAALYRTLVYNTIDSENWKKKFKKIEFSLCFLQIAPVFLRFSADRLLPH